MSKTSRKPMVELAVTILGGILMLAFLFGMVFLLTALDDSPNKCASKVATRVYDPNCF